MKKHKLFTQTMLSSLAAMILTTIAFAQPGIPIDTPGLQINSDQKPGSVLFYNYYTSSSTNSGAEDTEFSITNTNSTKSVTIHFFFVNSAGCTTLDFFICLTRNQTAVFYASEFDPDSKGRAVAVAIDNTGVPINHDFLIGSEAVKFANGRAGSFPAEAIGARKKNPANLSNNGTTATLSFDGTNYNKVPRVLALEKVRSLDSGSSTLLIINRVGGNLVTGAGTIGNLFGVLYDDAEQMYSWTQPAPNCQLARTLSDSFPNTTPQFSSVIFGTGWMKFWPAADVGVMGAFINLNAGAASVPRAFNSSHNLHHLTLTNDSLVIPVIPAGICN